MERENLFRVNIDKDEGSIDREEFILRRESASVRAIRKELGEKLSKSIMKSALGAHSLMRFFSVFFCIAGICCAVASLSYYSKNGVASGPILFLSIFFFALAGFCVIKKVYDKKKGESDPIDTVGDEYDRLNEIARRDLRVPSDAKTVELFGHFYRENSTISESYDVDQMVIFEEDGKLCLQHVGIVIAVPIDTIEAVVKVKDNISFSDWMKDVSYDSDEYSQYHIVKRQVNEYDEEYSMNGYYSIRFSKEGAPFELLVPLYEIQPFLDILKLEVTEE